MQGVATFPEKTEPKPFSAALLIGGKGRTRLHHRQVHICDFDTSELACGRGSGFTPCDIETGAGPVSRKRPGKGKREGAANVMARSLCGGHISQFCQKAF